jgi:hypothetical protein
VTVTHGFYRPTPGRLAELNAELQARFPDAGPDGWDDHVLNGGLVLAPLGECRPVPEPEPPYPEHDGHAVFRAFILRLYGRALGPAVVRPFWCQPFDSRPDRAGRSRLWECRSIA